MSSVNLGFAPGLFVSNAPPVHIMSSASRCSFLGRQRPCNVATLCHRVPSREIHKRGRMSPVAMAAGPDRALWAEGLTKTHDGERYQFRDISLVLPLGRKVALLGANGVGKSTLLHVLYGDSDVDKGFVSRKKGLSIAMVTQDLPAALSKKETVLQAVLRIAAKQTSSGNVRATLAYNTALYDVERGNTDDESLLRLTKASAAMEREPGAWEVDSYLRNALTKLGLPLDSIVEGLSGGQQRRLGLAAALVAKPNILLLDEPTNHLSLEGIEFLEEALQAPGMTCLCISHDRYFVDSMAEDIWELDGDLHQYGPGYANYLDMKAARMKSEAREQDNLMRTYKKELAWVRKQPKARGTKSKARVEKFEAIETKLAEAPKIRQVSGLATASSHLGGKVVALRDVTLKRGERLIVENFSYEFERGERVGIVPNGAGKSSLLRAMLGQLSVEAGDVDVGETVVFGHFDQDGLDLPDDTRVIEYITRLASLAGGGNFSKKAGASQAQGFEEQLDAQLVQLNYSVAAPTRKNEELNPLVKMGPYALLTQFGFASEQQHSFISTLSGGERRRLQLLSLLLGNANCMLLDECSNDIDIRTLSMLEELLDEFKGTLVMVSHDRFMLDRLVDHLIIVEGDGSCSYFEGKFTDYLIDKRAQEAATRKALQAQGRGAAKAKPVEEKAPPVKKLSFKERKELIRLENEVSTAEAKHAELSNKLVDEAETAGYSLLAEWTEELAKLENVITVKGERWMELEERNIE